MTGDGLTYRDHQRLQVKLSDCGVDLMTGLLAVHRQTQHGFSMSIGAGDHWDTPPPSRKSTDVLYVFTERGGTTGLTHRGV